MTGIGIGRTNLVGSPQWPYSSSSRHAAGGAGAGGGGLGLNEVAHVPECSFLYFDCFFFDSLQSCTRH